LVSTLFEDHEALTCDFEGYRQPWVNTPSG
jgi:hypothetical protein